MNLLKYLLIAAWFLFAGQVVAEETTRLLNEASDPQLQKGLAKLIEEQGLTGPVKAQQLGIILVIVTNPDQPRLAEFNSRQMVYAASLPKIAILLGAAVAIDEGRLELTSELEEDMHAMIRRSCNACATRVLEQVGRDELLKVLQSPKYNFYDQDGQGGLWVGKDYGPNTAYQRDPLSNLSHGATAFQAARFYYELHTGSLVSPEQNEMMLDMLSNPAINHKFVKGLQAYPHLELYRKSGSWKSYHADSALIRGDGIAYIIVALANHPNGNAWIEKLAAPLHELAVSHNK
jgi:beta-lactamase class A